MQRAKPLSDPSLGYTPPGVCIEVFCWVHLNPSKRPHYALCCLIATCNHIDLQHTFKETAVVCSIHGTGGTLSLQHGDVGQKGAAASKHDTRVVQIPASLQLPML